MVKKRRGNFRIIRRCWRLFYKDTRSYLDSSGNTPRKRPLAMHAAGEVRQVENGNKTYCNVKEK
jgi:hypothetical protein